MADDCHCTNRTDRTVESEPNAGYWIADASDTSLLDAQLPDELRTALGRFLGDESVETLSEWIDECRERIGDGSIEADDLCHADEPTGHRGTLERAGRRETYHFECFYDAVILSVLADRPVDVRTESPDGTAIEARASGSELTVTPPDAVVSFGIAEDVDPPSNGRAPREFYAAVCPYVRAFPDRDAYGRWAATVPAATMATSLEDATELAEAIVD